MSSTEGTSTPVAQPAARYVIKSVDRSLQILNLLSDGRRWMLSEIESAIGVSGSTAFRMLATLESRRFVERDSSAGYRIGPACIELAQAYSEASDIRRIALPVLEVLRDQTAETIHLGILDGMQIVYLEKRHGLHAIGLMSSRVGGRSPSYCTGLGKALLAYQDPLRVRDFYAEHGMRAYTDNTIVDPDELLDHLTEVRENGCAFDLGEHEHEVRCVAAPIFDSSGGPVAALSVSGPASRLSDIENDHELAEKTIQAARAVSRRLGYPSDTW